MKQRDDLDELVWDPWLM